MTPWVIKTVAAAALGAVGTGMVYGGYKGLLLAGDNRWVKQDSLVGKERRDLRRQVDELEFIQANERQLSDREKWNLRRLKSDLKEIEK